MRNTLLSAVLVIAAISFTGCSETDDGPVVTSLEVSLKKNRIVADNIDYTEALVSNQIGANVSDFASLYLDGRKLDDKRIRGTLAGFHSVTARLGSVVSNEVAIEFVEDKGLKFSKNVLMEQYTGTWCGWCPRAVNHIEQLTVTDKKVVHLAHHLSDEFAYSLNQPLFQQFGFTGVPTVHADRQLNWQGSVYDISAMHSPSPIGISISSTGTSSSISAEVKVKFGYLFTDFVGLTVYLVHDSLIANQANYYNTDPSSPYYQKGSTMVNFMHRNITIKSGSNLLGDAIPPSSIDIGSTYSKSIGFTQFRCDNIRKMHIVAVVTWQSGEATGKVINSAKARVGDNTGFVYASK